MLIILHIGGLYGLADYLHLLRHWLTQCPGTGSLRIEHAVEIRSTYCEQSRMRSVSLKPLSGSEESQAAFQSLLDYIRSLGPPPGTYTALVPQDGTDLPDTIIGDAYAAEQTALAAALASHTTACQANGPCDCC